MILELGEAPLRVERPGVLVDRVDYHHLEPDMPLSRRDLPQSMEQ